MLLWDRIARPSVGGTVNREQWQFLEILDFAFVPGGRVMHEPREDTRRPRSQLPSPSKGPASRIYRCLSESAMVYRTGGGVGTHLSASARKARGERNLSAIPSALRS
jgi:hypothetical protein